MEILKVSLRSNASIKKGKRSRMDGGADLEVLREFGGSLS